MSERESVRVSLRVSVRVRVTVRLRVTERVREMGTAFYQIYMCKEPMAASPHHRQMAQNGHPGDSNHRPAAYKAESLTIRVYCDVQMGRMWDLAYCQEAGKGKGKA